MKILLVGGSSSLGCALRAEAERRGHAVFSTYWSSESSQQDMRLDVRDEAAVMHGIQTAYEALGEIDALIYCAAVDNPSLIVQADLDAWKNVFDINFFGAARFAKHIIPRFIKSGSGVIEFISSGMATRSNQGATAYAASKAALNSLSKGISREYARMGITSFTVMPGFFDGGLIRNVEQRDRARIATLLDSRRIGTVDEVARFCLGALENSSYLTSANLEVNGGMA